MADRMGIGRDIAYAVGLTAASPVWGVSLLRTGKWRTDWAGRFGRVASRSGAPPRGPSTPGWGGKTVLIHGVSVGEINLVRLLVEELAARSPGLRIVIAATTNTGFARAEQLYGGRLEVVRFPLDFTFAVNRFLDAVRPDAVASVELEVWPNFVERCGRRGVPFCVVNGRLSERSFRRYMKVRGLIAGSFSRVARAAVQTEAYAERFRALGVPAERVAVLDTMKWDTAKIEDPSEVAGAERLASELGIDRSRPLVVAGSTGLGEDAMLIAGRPAEAQLLIAPRKPEWFDAVMRHAPGAVRRTAGESRASDVYLLDTIGELRKAYALADVCIVGRSFTGKLYGSDVMEPVGLGKATVIGPYHADFAETVSALREAGGLVVTSDPCGAARELLGRREVAAELAAAGRSVIRSRQGATGRHADMLLAVLDAAPGA